MLNKAQINDMEIEYSVVHRDIKYPRLELKTGKLILIVPKGYQNPQKLIEEHEEWIHNKLVAIEESKDRSKEKKLNYERSDEDLKQILLSNIEKYSGEMNVVPNRVTIRKMKSKWGSCSSKKNLNFNKFLKYLPDELMEYVVVHELAHLREKKHNDEFWTLISDRIGDYRGKEQELMDYWFLIQSDTNNRSE